MARCLVALLALLALGSIAAAQQATSWAIPPAQEAVVARMIGLGEASAGCRAEGARIEQTVVRASYRCEGARVELRLLHPHAADRAARRTARFAIVAPDAPATLVEAVAARVAAHEATFSWIRVGDDRRAQPSFADLPPSPPQTTRGLPAHLAERYARGLELHRRGEHEQALAIYVELARVHPRDGVLGMLVASLASTRPSLERAEALMRASDDAQGDPLAAFSAGVAAHYYAHQSGRDRWEKARLYESAIRYLERARPAYDFEPRLFIYLAVSRFRLGHQERAEALIERAVELGSDDPDAYYCRAEIFQRRDVERSIADLERYLAMTERLEAEGGVIAQSKQERVRAMLEHLRRAERGEGTSTALFDPTGAGPWLLRPGADPRRFAGGVALAALATAALCALARRRRREPG